MSDERKTVDHMIMEPVRQAAELIANRQGRDLSKIAEAIVYREAETAQATGAGIAHPAKRPPADVIPRTRVRFTTDRDRYDQALKRLRASGRSVAGVLEKGLEQYARTGTF